MPTCRLSKAKLGHPSLVARRSPSWAVGESSDGLCDGRTTVIIGVGTKREVHPVWQAVACV